MPWPSTLLCPRLLSTKWRQVKDRCLPSMVRRLSHSLVAPFPVGSIGRNVVNAYGPTWQPTTAFRWPSPCPPPRPLGRGWLMRDTLPGPVARALSSVERLRNVRAKVGHWPATPKEVRNAAVDWSGSVAWLRKGMKPSQRVAERARAASVRAFFAKREGAGR